MKRSLMRHYSLLSLLSIACFPFLSPVATQKKLPTKYEALRDYSNNLQDSLNGLLQRLSVSDNRCDSSLLVAKEQLRNHDAYLSDRNGSLFWMKSQKNSTDISVSDGQTNYRERGSNLFPKKKEPLSKDTDNNDGDNNQEEEGSSNEYLSDENELKQALEMSNRPHHDGDEGDKNNSNGDNNQEEEDSSHECLSDENELNLALEMSNRLHHDGDEGKGDKDNSDEGHPSKNLARTQTKRAYQPIKSVVSFVPKEINKLFPFMLFLLEKEEDPLYKYAKNILDFFSMPKELLSLIKAYCIGPEGSSQGLYRALLLTAAPFLVADEEPASHFWCLEWGCETPPNYVANRCRDFRLTYDYHKEVAEYKYRKLIKVTICRPRHECEEKTRSYKNELARQLALFLDSYPAILTSGKKELNLFYFFPEEHCDRYDGCKNNHFGLLFHGLYFLNKKAYRHLFLDLISQAKTNCIDLKTVHKRHTFFFSFDEGRSFFALHHHQAWFKGIKGLPERVVFLNSPGYEEGPFLLKNKSAMNLSALFLLEEYKKKKTKNPKTDFFSFIESYQQDEVEEEPCPTHDESGDVYENMYGDDSGEGNEL